MGDPTIPRHRRVRQARTTFGRFVDYGDNVLLADRHGNTWVLASVTVLSGGFGFREDGVERLPRPWKYDAAGVVVVEGDMVVIDFLDGDCRCPLVRGGIRGVQPNAFFAYNHEAAGAKGAGWNRLRARLTARDDTGALLGEVRFKLLDDDLGSMVLQATDSLRIEVGPVDAPTATITVEAGVVTLDGTTVKLGASAGDVAVLGNALVTAFGTHTHSGVTAGVAVTGPPVLGLVGVLSAKVQVE